MPSRIVTDSAQRVYRHLPLGSSFVQLDRDPDKIATALAETQSVEHYFVQLDRDTDKIATALAETLTQWSVQI